LSLFSVLNIAKGALSASQTCVQVTSNNIANVNTTGYAREEAELVESTTSSNGAFTLGDGVTVASITRYYDKYLESSLRSKTSQSNQQSVLSTYLDRVQQYLNEDNSNLSSNITSYFNDWQDLTTDPTSSGLKQTLVSQGQSVVQSISAIYTDLKGLQTEADSQVVSDVDSINGILSSIASLNQLIIEAGPDNSNTYLDQKTGLLDQLSAKMDITTFDDEYGRTTVLTTTGKPLVENGQSWSLTTITNSSGYSNVGWVGGGGSVTDITNEIGGGELKALIDTRDTYAPQFISGLNELSQALVDNVQWTVTSGSPSTSATTSFFVDKSAGSGDIAGSIAVSSSLVDDPTLISSTSDPDNSPTDNDIATAMAALADANLFDNGTSTFTEYTASLVSQSGQLTSDAQTAAESAANAVSTLTAQRASLSGVSIDEEMANLVKYQYAYEAASRLFTVADELLQSLMEVAK
jgi:flagellar hook-associated protein 1